MLSISPSAMRRTEHCRHCWHHLNYLSMAGLSVRSEPPWRKETFCWGVSIMGPGDCARWLANTQWWKLGSGQVKYCEEIKRPDQMRSDVSIAFGVVHLLLECWGLIAGWLLPGEALKRNETWLLTRRLLRGLRTGFSTVMGDTPTSGKRTQNGNFQGEPCITNRVRHKVYEKYCLLCHSICKPSFNSAHHEPVLYLSGDTKKARVSGLGCKTV